MVYLPAKTATMKITQFIMAFVCLSGLLSACSSSPTASPLIQPTSYPTEAVADYFPLAKGAYWIYEGNVKWTVGTDIFEDTIQWKMEVVDVVRRGDIVGYQMQGAPWDLAWYDKDKKPGEYAFIQVGSGRFYKASIENYQRLLDPEDYLEELVHEGMLFLDVPLLEGERFCDTYSITREDGLYCWRVSEEPQTQLTGVKGISVSAPLSEFLIFQITMPDSSEYNFVPGIGITRYKYVHHGTIAEVDVKLIEYHAGE